MIAEYMMVLSNNTQMFRIVCSLYLRCTTDHELLDVYRVVYLLAESRYSIKGPYSSLKTNMLYKQVNKILFLFFEGRVGLFNTNIILPAVFEKAAYPDGRTANRTGNFVRHKRTN